MGNTHMCRAASHAKTVASLEQTRNLSPPAPCRMIHVPEATSVGVVGAWWRGHRSVGGIRGPDGKFSFKGGCNAYRSTRYKSPNQLSFALQLFGSEVLSRRESMVGYPPFMEALQHNWLCHYSVSCAPHLGADPCFMDVSGASRAGAGRHAV